MCAPYQIMGKSCPFFSIAFVKNKFTNNNLQTDDVSDLLQMLFKF
jgi:hypothetical protein